MKNPKLFYTPLIFAIFQAFIPTVFAQILPPPPLIEEDKEIIKVESRLVIVPVSITDGNGNPITGLTSENFRIMENRRRQKITEVSAAEKVPMEIALLFDVSGSTDAMFKFEQQTAAKFLESVMRPEDRATIFTISDQPFLVQNRNIAFRSVETIRGLKRSRKQTAFFDTVIAAANYLHKNSPPKSRKVIITISDGEDNASNGIRIGYSRAYTFVEKQDSLTSDKQQLLLTKKRNQVRIREQDKTLRSLQNADAVFYSINPAGSSYRLNKISIKGQDNMERFAKETGGTAFLPNFSPIDLESQYQNSANIERNTKILKQIFRKLANELKAQYLVQYYSDSEYPAEKYVKLDVKINLNLPQGVKIRARQGYFVKSQ